MIHKIGEDGQRSTVPILLIAACAAAFAAPAAETPQGKASEKPPPVIGAMTPDSILGLTPAWGEAYEHYKPGGESLEAIHSSLERDRGRIRAEVVLGTWCGDSRRQVPKFLKIRDIVGRSLLPTRFTGVDRSKKVTEEDLAVRIVERVPTFILYRGEKEIGRIIETPRASMEEDLVAILKAPAAR